MAVGLVTLFHFPAVVESPSSRRRTARQACSAYQASSLDMMTKSLAFNANSAIVTQSVIAAVGVGFESATPAQALPDIR